MKMNKKGSFGDMIYLSVIVFVTAVMIAIGWLVFSSINTEWQKHPTELGTNSLEIMQASNDKYVALFDNIFLILMVGLYIGALVLAYMVDINPIFFFLSLFVMGVIVLLTGAFGNAWYAVANDATMAGYIDDFTIIPFVMGNYVVVFTVMSFGLAGVMYAKTR